MSVTLNISLQPEETKERCGLILSNGTVVEITNIASEPEISYEMEPTEVLPHLTEETVVGTWHTHPQSSPHLSAEDQVGFMAWPSLTHYIVGKDGETKCYRVANGALLECE